MYRYKILKYSFVHWTRLLSLLGAYLVAVPTPNLLIILEIGVFMLTFLEKETKKDPLDI